MRWEIKYILRTNIDWALLLVNMLFEMANFWFELYIGFSKPVFTTTINIAKLNNTHYHCLNLHHEQSEHYFVPKR